jgi:hypothetical protein
MRRRSNVSEEREFNQGPEANEAPEVEAHLKQGREADASTASEEVEAHLKQGREADASTVSEDVEAHVKPGREMKDDADTNIENAG